MTKHNLERELRCPFSKSERGRVRRMERRNVRAAKWAGLQESAI